MHYGGAVRRAALFVIGAAILWGELETHDQYPARPVVVVLALVLMGVVSLDQLYRWFAGRTTIPDGTHRRPDGTPAMAPEAPQRPPDPPAPPTPP